MYLERLAQMESELSAIEDKDSPAWAKLTTLIEGYYWCKEDIEEHENRQVYLHPEFEGEEYFMMEAAVAKLINEDILFVVMGKTGYERTEMMVNCNDLFAWGCSDAEPVPAYDLEKLYNAWKDDERWGAYKWCAKHRNQQPQEPIIRDMKKDGAWDNEMDALPKNEGMAGWIENIQNKTQ